MDLITTLDKAVSVYVRKRDNNCISCGKRIEFSECDAGHYIPRTHMATRFDLRNVNAQCVECNRFQSGNIDAYKKGLLIKYGEYVVDELDRLKRTTYKYSQSELKELLQDVRILTKQLENG